MRILPKRANWGNEPSLSRLLTTADVAKVLEVSTRGIRWLVACGDLACERTRAGTMIFHIGEVQRCALQRAETRTSSRSDALRGAHVRMVKAGHEPQQLSFLRGLGLRVVARGVRSLPDSAVKVARSFQEQVGSDRRGYVDRKRAGSG